MATAGAIYIAPNLRQRTESTIERRTMRFRSPGNFLKVLIWVVLVAGGTQIEGGKKTSLAGEAEEEFIVAGGNENAISVLEGSWEITWVADGNIPSGTTPSLAFENGEVKGFAGCNYFWSEVLPIDDGFRFSPAAVDPLVCSPEIMELESAVLRAVMVVTGFQIEPNGTLTLLSVSDPVMRARR